MPLTMRPTVDRQEPAGLHQGRIYQQRGGPDSMRWFWSLHGTFGKPFDMRTDGHAATLDGAKAQFNRYAALLLSPEDT